MSADFTTVFPPDGAEPWEAECDWCGILMDLDHYGDMQIHTWEHRDAEDYNLTHKPRHREE